MLVRIFSFYLTAYRGVEKWVGETGSRNLELLEGLLVALRLGHLQRVELHRLGERPALANRHHVADLQEKDILFS